MQVQAIQNNNTKFGMAVTISPKAKKILEDRLTTNAAKELKTIIETEKTNPTDVIITTEKRYMALYQTPEEYWTDYDVLAIKVEDKKFKSNVLTAIFSVSNATKSAIKRAVKYAQELTQKRDLINTVEK